MELLVYLFILFLVVGCVLDVRAGRKRIKKAYTWDKPNIHGQRKFATDEELKKAGLL